MADRDDWALTVREAFLELVASGWKARDFGLTEAEALVMAAESMEPLVQKLTDRLARP